MFRARDEIYIQESPLILQEELFSFDNCYYLPNDNDSFGWIKGIISKINCICFGLSLFSSFFLQIFQKISRCFFSDPFHPYFTQSLTYLWAFFDIMHVCWDYSQNKDPGRPLVGAVSDMLLATISIFLLDWIYFYSNLSPEILIQWPCDQITHYLMCRSECKFNSTSFSGEAGYFEYVIIG